MQNLGEMQKQGQPSEPLTPQSEPVIPASEPLTPPVTSPPEPLPQRAKTADNATGGAVQAEPSLEEQLASAEAKTTQLEDAFLRAKTEVGNSRRRAQEDIARAHRFANW